MGCSRHESTVVGEVMIEHPRCVQIETHNFCNARCWFCPVSKMKRERGRMSMELFDSILEQLVEHPPKIIYPFLNGEPFLDTRMPTFLKRIGKKLPNSKVIIFTNGSLLNKRISKWLLKNCKNLSEMWFSINAKPEKYKETMGLNWEVTQRNIKNFLRLRRQFNREDCKVVWSFVGANPADILTWIARSKGVYNDVQLFFSPVKNWAGDVTNHPDTTRRIISPCLRVFDYLTILWDGRVCLCCMDVEGRVVFGDLNKQTIEEVWNSELAKHYRLLHSNHEWWKLPLCKDCTGA